MEKLHTSQLLVQVILDLNCFFEAKKHQDLLIHERLMAIYAEADVTIDIGYPFVENNPALTDTAWQLAKEYWGNENVEETELRMGAEDFGYYAQIIPGCFYRLGVRNEEKEIIHNVHTPKFNIDEEAIGNGIEMMTWLAMKANV